MSTLNAIHKQITRWLGLAILLLLLLAAGLPNMVLHEGTQYASTWRLQTVIGEVNLVPVLYFGLTIIVLTLAIYLRRRTWRNFGRTMLAVTAFLAVIVVIITFAPIVEIEPIEEEEQVVQEEPVPEMEEAESIQEVQPVVDLGETESVPAWVSLLVSVAWVFLFLIILVSMFYILIRLVPESPLVEEGTPLDEVRQQAQTAVYALQQGKPLANVILRCYADMEQAVRTQLGIERQQAMTVREFEQKVIQLGLPAEAVATLIHLFEQVRYGRYTPQSQDQTQAINSLNQIIAATTKNSLGG